MRALRVADVGHGLAAILWRSRHAPARHDKLALAIDASANDRGHLVGNDRRQGGRLPARSCFTLNKSRMADWPLVTL
jgi:hypothetical protein